MSKAKVTDQVQIKKKAFCYNYVWTGGEGDLNF